MKTMDLWEYHVATHTCKQDIFCPRCGVKMCELCSVVHCGLGYKQFCKDCSNKISKED